MTPGTRRIVIPVIVFAVVIGLVAIVALAPRHNKTPRPVTPPVPAAADAATNGAAPVIASDGTAAPDPATTGEIDPATVAPTVEAALGTFEGLHAVRPDGAAPTTIIGAELGSDTAPSERLYATTTRAGAGLDEIILTQIWNTAADRRADERHRRAVAAGVANPPPPPDPAERYLLKTSTTIGGETISILSAHSIEINGAMVALVDASVWSETEPHRFETTIVDSNDAPIARIVRRYTHESGTYQIRLDQWVENLSNASMDVRWAQYGPGDLFVDRARYMDRRRFRFGYLLDPSLDPDRKAVLSTDGKLIYERADALKEKHVTLWPNRRSDSERYELSWFASTNRYFGLVVHAPFDPAVPGSASFADTVGTIQRVVVDRGTPDEFIATSLQSPVRRVDAGGTARFDMGIYAGPLDREILSTAPPLAALNMPQLVLYQMSNFCAICTFQWLAKGLLAFLSLVDTIIGDWGIAIIMLVALVRLILHPITKKSQISMQKFSKQMQVLKPEMDKLQKKFPGDQKRIQTEQMRLFREHGVNPLGMLGCLPMFLQMPIWVALYAMLYFAWDLRQEPAFWGVFQHFGGWSFLADLSSPDHCFGQFDTPKQFFFWNITGINLLPFLMGAIFFLQQKYMTPPNPTASKEMRSQQKMMQIMMVVLFPLMLYSAPSGLTLYILTSSCVGIIESRHVRKHVDQMDFTKPPPQRAAAAKPWDNDRKKKPKDPMARLYADRLERAKAKKKGPNRRFKKRGDG